MTEDDVDLKDYELKAVYLTNQFSRMWTRFNFLLVLQAGLLAAAVNSNGHGAQIALIWAEVLISLVWYLFGAQDRYLVAVYRVELELAAERLRYKGNPPTLRSYPFVGQVDGLEPLPIRHRSLEPRRGADGEKVAPLGIQRNFLQWRYPNASVTHLAVWFPVLAFLVWLPVAIVMTVKFHSSL